MATLLAIASASAPLPTTKRPIAITAKLGLSAVTTRPAKTIAPNSAIDRFVPTLSMTTPKISIVTMFGKW